MKEKMFGPYTWPFWDSYCARQLSMTRPTIYEGIAGERFERGDLVTTRDGLLYRAAPVYTKESTMSTKEKIAVMSHYASGGIVQWRPAGAPDKCWEDYTQGEPLWNWMDGEYRIKPKEPRNIYYVEYSTGLRRANNEEDARRRFRETHEAKAVCRFVEDVDYTA